MEAEELVAEYKAVLKKAFSSLDEGDIEILATAVDGDPGFIEAMVEVLAEVAG